MQSEAGKGPGRRPGQGFDEGYDRIFKKQPPQVPQEVDKEADRQDEAIAWQVCLSEKDDEWEPITRSDYERMGKLGITVRALTAARSAEAQ